MTPRDMRVLIVSHGHPTFSLGGAEVASYNLFNGLNATPGCEGHYLARIAPPVSQHRGTAFLSLRQKEREILFHANDYDHFRMSNRDIDSIEQDFVRYVRDLEPDVVHFHHFLGLGIECLYALKKAMPRLPIVVTLHEYLSICNHHGQMIKTTKGTLCYRASPAECAMCFPHIGENRFFRREAFIKTFLGMADHYISPSWFLIDRYVEWGLPRKKFSMIENGLNITEIAPPRPLPRNGRRNRFGFFGQITRFKGLHVLLDAVSRVPDEVWGEDSVLLVFGGNLEHQPEAFQEEFKRLTERAGRRMRLYGSYRSVELPGLIKDIDWVVMPSIWWENSPLVIQEAFLHGRPLICSNIGGMAEKVRPNVDGLHFRVGGVEDLVDRLTETIREPQIWDRLRANIRRPLTQEECARQHVAIYQTLLGHPAAAPKGESPRLVSIAGRPPAGAA